MFMLNFAGLEQVREAVRCYKVVELKGEICVITAYINAEIS